MTHERYDRQLPLPQIGPDGQARLGASSVLVVGAGGLGAPVLLYLAAAGVGRLGIVDGDVVALSNLNRQVLYTESDIGKRKALCASAHIRARNADIAVDVHDEALAEHNAQELLAQYDCAVLCLDNFEARRTANCAAVALRKPFVEGAVSGYFGKITTVIPYKTPCYDCLYRDAQPEEKPIPVLGAVAGMVGSMMALAALDLLLGQEDAARGGIVAVDGRSLSAQTLPVERDPACPVCGQVQA